jgi:nucleoside-diphosphate-sugar epimerase
MSRKIALAKLRNTKEVSIWGDGEATRSFMYVGDCVAAVYDLMLSDCGMPITLGPDRSISINGLVDIIGTIADIEIEKVYVNEGHQGVRGRKFDHTACREAIGWIPSTDIECGMIETYRWVEKQVEEAIRKGEL